MNDMKVDSVCKYCNGPCEENFSTCEPCLVERYGNVDWANVVVHLASSAC